LEGLEDAGFGGGRVVSGDLGGKAIDAPDDEFQGSGLGDLAGVARAGVEPGQEGGKVRGEGPIAGGASELEGEAEP
jgi:hypothetical protein